jgi:signal transduction histidine kinase
MMQSRRSLFLTTAFAALLLVMGVSTLLVGRNARNAQSRVTELTEARMRTDDDLDAIRNNVYQIGIITRDYLLDPDPASANQYFEQFGMVRADTEKSFDNLSSAGIGDVPPVGLQDLRREFGAYSDLSAVVLNWSPEQKRTLGEDMLRQRFRRRQEIFALTGQVESLVTASFENREEQIRKSDEQFRASLNRISIGALLLGIGISVVTLLHVKRLEKQSRLAESELRSLSGQLRTTQEQERKYLSRELHDQVGQLLTGLRMELGGIARTAEHMGGEIAARITRAKGIAEQVLRVVRDIAMLLRPSMLDDLGLTPALDWLGREVSRSSGMEIQMDIELAANTLPEAHRTCLYRVVQEALTNAARHSGARKVHVVLKTSGAWVSGTISDDGRGFESNSGRMKGLGLIGMQERVRELGGSIRIVSSLGRGTRIEIRLPCPDQPEVVDAADSDRGRSRDRTDRLEASARPPA